MKISNRSEKLNLNAIKSIFLLESQTPENQIYLKAWHCFPILTSKSELSDFIRCTSNEELFFNYNYANPIGIDLDFENDTQEQYRFVMYPQDALQDQSEVENNIHIVQLGTHASNELECRSNKIL